MRRPMQIVAMWMKKSRQVLAAWWAGWTSSMGAFSFVGFGTCAVCGVSHSWADAIVTALAAVTSASGSSFGDSGVSGMQFLVGVAPLDYQRFVGAPKELGGKLPGNGISGNYDLDNGTNLPKT